MNPKLKKYIPFILLGLGVLVLGGVFFAVRGNKSVNTADTEEAGLMNVPLSKRPIVALTPDKPGNYLKLQVEKLDGIGAQTMDYELVYQVPDGPSQGVPGTVEIKGMSSFENNLLLGSESAGKFRYDEGVETGTLTLRFRDANGKLLAKFSSEFKMQQNPTEVLSQDGKLSVKLDNAAEGFFVTMPSIGVPQDITGVPKVGPYVIRSSNGDQFSGTASIQGANVFHFEDGNWKKLDDGKAKDLGYFYGI